MALLAMAPQPAFDSSKHDVSRFVSCGQPANDNGGPQPAFVGP